MTYTYRPAQTRDAAAFNTIIREWADETPWMCMLDTPASMIEFWAGVIEHDHAWVAEHGDRVVGICARSDDNISGLYVAKAARGAGVGKALLDLAKENRDWITVWAYEKNAEARRFYRREGLVEIKRETEVYDDGTELMDVEHRWTRPK